MARDPRYARRHFARPKGLAYRQPSHPEGRMGFLRRHFFRKLEPGFGAEAVDPKIDGLAGCREEPFPIRVAEFLSHSDGRKLRGVENFIRIRVSNPADDTRIGEGAFEGMVLASQA